MIPCFSSRSHRFVKVLAGSGQPGSAGICSLAEQRPPRADLRGPTFHRLHFVVFRRTGVGIGLRAGFERILHYIWNRIHSRGSRGLPRSPESRKSAEQSAHRFLWFVFPEVGPPPGPSPSSRLWPKGDVQPAVDRRIRETVENALSRSDSMWTNASNEKVGDL